MGVPQGIHYENVSRFFRDKVPGGDCVLSIEQISGGRSNITYLVRGGDTEWVLRRPPLGHVLPTAHDMAREYKVLTALWDTNVPVPRTYALCEDGDVNDMPFYVMEYCPGVVLSDDIPAGYAENSEERRSVSLNLVETLTRLHAVDYRAVGLGDFGHPERPKYRSSHPHGGREKELFLAQDSFPVGSSESRHYFACTRYPMGPTT